MIGIQKIPIVARDLTVDLYAVFGLELTDGFFRVRSVVSGDPVRIVAEIL